VSYARVIYDEAWFVSDITAEVFRDCHGDGGLHLNAHDVIECVTPRQRDRDRTSVVSKAQPWATMVKQLAGVTILAMVRIELGL
jgi:hypothetical protein